MNNKNLLLTYGTIVLFLSAHAFSQGAVNPSSANLSVTERASTKTNTFEVSVQEQSGIRRFGYPVNAQVPFRKGTLSSSDQVRLRQNKTELPAQYGVQSRWEDGTIQWMTIDWNISIGPLEKALFYVEYGPNVKRSRKATGLLVTETDQSIQVGEFRFRKDGWPLIESCTHMKAENVGQGGNGLIISDTEGHIFDFQNASDLSARIVKPGPIHVKIQYQGTWKTPSGSSITFHTEIELPNSKSLWKVTHRAHDPRGKLDHIRLLTPFQLGKLPLVWDFGTGSWTYGQLRTPQESAVLEQNIFDKQDRSSSNWIVKHGIPANLLPYEVGHGERARASEGWGHLIGERVVAFAMTDFGRQEGLYSLSVSGNGSSEFSYHAPNGKSRLSLTVFQHFVNLPVQIGAATSPPAMLNSLMTGCRKDYYDYCGVQPSKHLIH